MGNVYSVHQMATALEQFVVAHGGLHEDDCPADDTCSCSWVHINEAVNAAIHYLRGNVKNITEERAPLGY